jgi:PAS domain S-box-containing protein
MYSADGELNTGTAGDLKEFRKSPALTLVPGSLPGAEDELNLLYDSAPFGICLVDREHRFLRVNACLAKITGVPLTAHFGSLLSEILPNLCRAFAPFYDRVFESGEPIHDAIITGHTAASFSERYLLASFHPVRADTGAVWAVSTIIQDVTEQKQHEREIEQANQRIDESLIRLRLSEQQAQRANQAKSNFLADISHEIRTPMTAILGYADVLLDQLEDPVDRECVLIMKRNGNHLLNLINDILDISRIEAGKLCIEKSLCDLPILMRDIESLMQVRAAEKNLTLKLEMIGQLPNLIEADEKWLKQVLINLVGNSIKFTETGTISIRVRLEEAAPSPSESTQTEAQPVINFEVEDTGIGIPLHQVNTLFESYTQGDAARARKFGGSGLGLSICKRLVDLMNGSVSLKSQVGVGTIFNVRIPVGIVWDAAAPGTAANPRATSQLAANTSFGMKPCRVLLVDDRRDVRYVAQHFLAQAGAHVSVATNGAAALELVRHSQATGEPFQIIVMDMEMPVVDGYSATLQLRAEGFDLPIIALTASAMNSDRQRCMDAGCTEYLTKPISPPTLIDTVARLLSNPPSPTLRNTKRRHPR